MHLRVVTTVLILFIFPISALAAVVCETPQTPINALELRKPLVLSGDYEEFLWTIPAARSDLDRLSAQAKEMEEAFPNGFSHCKTVGQNWISENLVSELIVYRTEGDEFLYISWTAFHIEDLWVVGKYAVNTSFSAAYESIR